MRLLFLDIDGVLNSQQWYRQRKKLTQERHFCPANVDRLNSILEQTNARIVVSSTWRKGRSVDELQSLLKGVGVRTDREVGLSEADVVAVVKILKNDPMTTDPQIPGS